MPDAIVFAATPFDFALAPGRTALVVIDMQRDFVEPGGFGASLGNDVTRLHPAIPVIAALLAAWRERGWPVVHTREAHRPDLSDCPPAKRLRGAPPLRIGDIGPMGRLLVAGEPGSDIVAAVAPEPGEIVVDKPGKGMFWATGLHETLQARGITHLSSPASRPKSACRPRCARPTTAATTACSSRMAPRATSRSSRRRRWP